MANKSLGSEKRNLPEISRKDLGLFLKRARKSARLTQIDVSRALGISQSAWSKFENGIHEPIVTVYMRFCVLAKVPPESLIPRS